MHNRPYSESRFKKDAWELCRDEVKKVLKVPCSITVKHMKTPLQLPKINYK